MKVLVLLTLIVLCFSQVDWIKQNPQKSIKKDEIETIPEIKDLPNVPKKAQEIQTPQNPKQSDNRFKDEEKKQNHQPNFPPEIDEQMRRQFQRNQNGRNNEHSKSSHSHTKRFKQNGSPQHQSNSSKHSHSRKNHSLGGIVIISIALGLSVYCCVRCCIRKRKRRMCSQGQMQNQFINNPTKLEQEITKQTNKLKKLQNMKYHHQQQQRQQQQQGLRIYPNQQQIYRGNNNYVHQQPFNYAQPPYMKQQTYAQPQHTKQPTYPQPTYPQPTYPKVPLNYAEKPHLSPKRQLNHFEESYEMINDHQHNYIPMGKPINSRDNDSSFASEYPQL